MGRNRYCGYLGETNRGYLVAFDLHWRVLESRRVDPLLGAATALEAFVSEFEAKGWSAESDALYGFLFLNRGGQCILVEATPRDPFDTAQQSFDPFK
jgi:hypothetical protein